MGRRIPTARSASLLISARATAFECGRGNADCDFQPRRRQKRTESGLSERHFEFKSFTIIVARNRTGSRRKIADWERTEKARRDSAKFLRMMVARDGVEPPTPAFSVLRYAVF